LDGAPFIGKARDSFWADGDSLMDFGSLQVSWPLETPLEGHLPAMDATLETFYRLSYALHRLKRQSSKRD
jgi:hypothetical protein